MAIYAATFVAGAGFTFNFTTDEDITGATEIKFALQHARAATVRVQKSLTGGGISAVDGTHFNVTMLNADTINVPPEDYKIQAEVTLSGVVKPARVKITATGEYAEQVKILQRLAFT